MGFKTAWGCIRQKLARVFRRRQPQAAPPLAPEEAGGVSRMLGLALQGQGQLDLAFEQFRRVTLGDAIRQDLRGLALDFERKQQFSQAEAVLRYMASDTSDGPVHAPLMAIPQRTVPASGSGNGRAMLGQYQLEKELGKGAMGVVYLGKATASGRVVALKTMALSDEFEGRDLLDARERFFREAETAGRLKHPHIVTIYEAGEAQGLAFIAMEFLKGTDLAGYCQYDRLLPVPTVISIVARVAEALACAHRQNVVHRDIKPANIM